MKIKSESDLRAEPPLQEIHGTESSSSIGQSNFPRDAGYRQRHASDDIDFNKIWLMLWRDKLMILAIVALFSGAAILFALSIPNEYRSTAILFPTASSNGSSLTKIASRLGGLASLAGVNFGASSDNEKTIVAMKLVETWSFLESFIRDNNIEVAVFASKSWDRHSNQLIIDDELFSLKRNEWIRDVEPERGGYSEPSGWELYDVFSDKVHISQDKETGLISLSVDFYSPFLAKEWVDKMVAAINSHLRERDKEEALKSIQYLKEQLENTQVSEMRNIFYQLIEEQTKTLMLAEITDEYVFKTISPAKVPEEKTYPKRAFIVLLITFLGFIVAGVFIIIKNLSSQEVGK